MLLHFRSKLRSLHCGTAFAKMSTAQSWLSELDQVIAVHGGVATLQSSSASSDMAVLTLRTTLQSYVDVNGPDVDLPADLRDWVPIDLPKWVPRPNAATSSQQFRIASGSVTSSSKKACLLYTSDAADE